MTNLAERSASNFSNSRRPSGADRSAECTWFFLVTEGTVPHLGILSTGAMCDSTWFIPDNSGTFMNIFVSLGTVMGSVAP